MRWFIAIVTLVFVTACQESAEGRRISGGSNSPDQVENVSSVADQVLSRPIGYVGDRAPRTAFVIRNSNYVHLANLDNPSNDARLVAKSLSSLGFRLEGGGPQTNLTLAQMRSAIATYRSKLASRGGVGIVYFAGHAVHVQGRNWLAPTDVMLTSLSDVSRQFVPAEELFGRGSNDKAVNMVVLDACRDNPFEAVPGARVSGIDALRGTSAGLSRIVAPPDTLVAFATAPGAVALDGTGANSPYAAALARSLSESGTRVEDVFIRVRNIVEKSTNGFQTPWETSSLRQRVVLNSGRSGSLHTTAQFDGTYIGRLLCDATPDDTRSNDFTRGAGRTIRVDISDGRDRYLKGPPQPLKSWAGGLYHESFDFRISEGGNVHAPGTYQYVDEDHIANPKPGAPMITDSALMQGKATPDGMLLKGTRGPRQCVIELTKV